MVVAEKRRLVLDLKLVVVYGGAAIGDGGVVREGGKGNELREKKKNLYAYGWCLCNSKSITLVFYSLI